MDLEVVETETSMDVAAGIGFDAPLPDCMSSADILSLIYAMKTYKCLDDELNDHDDRLEVYTDQLQDHCIKEDQSSEEEKDKEQ